MRNAGRMLLVMSVLVLMSGSALPGQTPATGQVMRAKLGHAEKVLEALMTSDYGLLQTESRALAAVVKDPRWAVLTSPRYARDSSRFEEAASDLAQAAAARNSEDAMRAYVAVTLACYQCHSDMKGARIAK